MGLTNGGVSRHKVYTLTRKVQVLLRVFNRKINASALYSKWATRQCQTTMTVTLPSTLLGRTCTNYNCFETSYRGDFRPRLTGS